MLDLPRVKVRQEGDVIIITHKTMNAEVKLTTARLDTWAVKILRESISQPVAKEAS